MNIDEIKEIVCQADLKNSFIELKHIIKDIISAIREAGATEEENIAFMRAVYISLLLGHFFPLVEYWIKEVYKENME